MILDNQQQKNLLIKIIENTGLQGTYKELKRVDMPILDNLLQAVQNAEIAKESIMESARNAKEVEANNIKERRKKMEEDENK